MEYRVYTDGAFNPRTGRGGWAALVVDPSGGRRALSGGEEGTTSNRMELTAAIRGLEAVPPGAEVTLYSDSQYLVRDMQARQQGRPRGRNRNLDLWGQLDRLAFSRRVRWAWVRGHAGNLEQEFVNALASYRAGNRPDPPQPFWGGGLNPTHLDAQGHARMVDVGPKPETEREAVARGRVYMAPATLEMVRQGPSAKGDVMAVARLAGIMAAKRTAELVPLCHPIPLTHIQVDLEPKEGEGAVEVRAQVRTTWKTGVEMEALCAVAVACLTVYDMCKAVDPAMRISDIRLVRKRGGLSGDVLLEEE